LCRTSNVQEKDRCFEAGLPIVDSLAAHDNTGQILANGAVFRTDRARTNPHGKLCPERESPSRAQNDPSLCYAEISVRPETTIDPVVEINRELCAWGIT
jgi:hypothetical protein